jgi:hypothetical protein
MIQLWWPVTFKGKRDRVTGRFLAVMWEKLAYPIISHWGESIYVAVSAPMVQAHVRRLAATAGYQFQPRTEMKALISVPVAEL